MTRHGLHPAQAGDDLVRPTTPAAPAAAYALLVVMMIADRTTHLAWKRSIHTAAVEQISETHRLVLLPETSRAPDG